MTKVNFNQISEANRICPTVETHCNAFLQNKKECITN
jgi:hypothetical protein